MKTFKVKIKGDTPLLQHRMTDEELFGLLGAKQKKKAPKEELTPREIAEKYVYRQEKTGHFYVPMSYFTGAFKHVASDYKQTNSTRKSIKAVAGGVFRPCSDHAVLTNNKKPIKDFEVDVRKATNHQKGAIAVCRPRFDEWETEFDVMIDDSIITAEIALQILNDAGKRSGIGSFRVSKGGYFGQFSVTEWTQVKTKY